MEEKYLIDSKIPVIDVIRCIATIQIVLFHMIAIEEYFSSPMVLWGREGVGLFFAISGAGLINRHYYQFDCKSYYKKRIISLYMPFWVAYIAVFVRNYFLNGFVFPWDIFGIRKEYILLSVFGVDGFAGAFGVPNFSLIGGWFIAVIAFIYLIFPIYRKMFIRFPEFTVIFFLILRVIVCLKNPIPQLAVCFNPITALSNFSIGAYLTFFFSKKSVKYKKKYILAISIIFIAISIIFIVLGKYLTLQKGQPDIGEIFATLGLLFILIIIAPFIAKRLSKFVKFICDISYEIFLVHQVVIYAIISVIHNNFTIFHAIIGYIYILSIVFIFSYVLKKFVNPIIKFLINFRFNKFFKQKKSISS